VDTGMEVLVSTQRSYRCLLASLQQSMDTRLIIFFISNGISQDIVFLFRFAEGNRFFGEVIEQLME